MASAHVLHLPSIMLQGILKMRVSGRFLGGRVSRQKGFPAEELPGRRVSGQGSGGVEGIQEPQTVSGSKETRLKTQVW